MSGECEDCNEHTLDCTCEKIRITIKAPKGMEIRKCPICEFPFLYDSKQENCVLCELNKRNDVK